MINKSRRVGDYLLSYDAAGFKEKIFDFFICFLYMTNLVVIAKVVLLILIKMTLKYESNASRLP